METNINENISQLSRKEITIRRERLNRDKKFVQNKVIFWNEQIRNLLNFEKQIINRQRELTGLCEVCGIQKTIEELKKDRLRTLPTGEQVCVKCWKNHMNEILMKNANNLMKG